MFFHEISFMSLSLDGPWVWMSFDIVFTAILKASWYSFPCFSASDLFIVFLMSFLCYGDPRWCQMGLQFLRRCPSFFNHFSDPVPEGVLGGSLAHFGTLITLLDAFGSLLAPLWMILDRFGSMSALFCLFCITFGFHICIEKPTFRHPNLWSSWRTTTDPPVERTVFFWVTSGMLP